MIRNIDQTYVASIPSPETSNNTGWIDCMVWCYDRDIEFNYRGEGVFEFGTPENRTAFLLRWA